MKVQIYTDTTGFEELEPEWNALLERSITNTPFSTYQWHHLWWKAYEPGDLWLLSFRDEADMLRGIASFFIEHHPEQGRVVHFVGCEDVTDYLDILVDEAYLEAVYTALADTLVAEKDHYDVLDLCNIPAESPTRTLLPDYLEARGFTQVQLTVQEVCPLISLPETFDDYLKMLDKKQRKEVQRKLRITAGQGDSVRWYISNGSSDIHEEVEKFLSLMASSHPEKAEFLQNEQHVRFFKSIVPAAHEAGWLQLNFLEVAGDAVAAYVNFDYGNRVLVYNSGLAPDKASALSPGIVLLAYNIEHAISMKREAFDFLRGDEQYKYRMGAETTEVYNLKAL